MKRFFITGTDTDCGKTYVTCQLLNYVTQHHYRALGIKPIASGCVWEGGQWVSEDARSLQSHSIPMQEDTAPSRLEFPISPHLAAEAQGYSLTLKSITDYCVDAERAQPDYLFIEGAGGLMAPLNEKETWLDFLQGSRIPVILVVGMRLGCLNHALLTDLVLASHQVTCIGWIANVLDRHMLALPENIETLTKRLKAPYLATIPYQGILEGDSLMKTLASCCSVAQN